MTRRAVLAGTASAGLLALGAGTAGADPQGQVGTSSTPLRALYTAELNGPITDAGSGPQAVTSLLGDGLSVDSGTLSATDARLTVSDGSTTVENVEGITFGNGLSVTDDGDGTVTIE